MIGRHIAMSIPRGLADLLDVEPAMSLRYPDTRSGHGYVTGISVAMWLSDNGWPSGATQAGQDTLRAAYRLLFYRWLFEPQFLERGGRPNDAALSQQGEGQR